MPRERCREESSPKRCPHRGRDREGFSGRQDDGPGCAGLDNPLVEGDVSPAANDDVLGEDSFGLGDLQAGLDLARGKGVRNGHHHTARQDTAEVDHHALMRHGHVDRNGVSLLKSGSRSPQATRSAWVCSSATVML